MSIDKRWWWVAAVCVVVGAIVCVTCFLDDKPAASVGAGAIALVPSVERKTVAMSNDSEADPALVESSSQDERVDNDTMFRVTATGELILDEQLRLNIEELVAQTQPSELYREVREHSEELAPSAAQLAHDIVAKFVLYQQAQQQAYAPDRTLTSEEAILELEGLHALRVAHFGSELAQRFYGREETVAREMIEVIRLEGDQSLTPAEKAERMRALREQLPGVAGIEKRNRAADRSRAK